MNFKTLYETISPRLKRIARSHNNHRAFIDGDDLYQEMCIHLWSKFKNGVPDGVNEAYIVRGCEFYILNYLRKVREKAALLSLEEPVNEDGGTLGDILPDTKEPVDRCIDRKAVIEDIKNNGFSRREKEVFLLLLEGYTVREIGGKLRISHVMVIKFKQRIIKKCQKEKNKRLPKRADIYLCK